MKENNIEVSYSDKTILSSEQEYGARTISYDVSKINNGHEIIYIVHRNSSADWEGTETDCIYTTTKEIIEVSFVITETNNEVLIISLIDWTKVEYTQ